MYANQQHLPVDPHHPHEWAFNPRLPNVVPFIPPISCGPQIQPYAQLITGHAMLEAQNNAGRNPLRTFYFNMLSLNNFQNQEFFELVQSVAELTEFLVVARHKDVISAAQEAARTMNSVQASLMIQKFPTLEPLLTHEVKTGASNWIRQFMNLAQEIKQFQSPPPTTYGHAGGYGQPPGTYMQSMYQDPRTSAAHGASYGRGYFQESAGGVAGGSSIMGGLTKTNQPHRQNDIVEVGMFADQPEPIIKRRADVSSTGEQQPSQDVAESAPVNTDAPASKERFWDDYTLQNGARIKPAHLSKWEVSKTEEQPYRMAYHPSKHCLFHGKHESGLVEEVLVPWEASETMDYLRNEIRSDMRKAVPKDPHAPKMVPKYDLLATMAPVTDSMLGVYKPVEGEEATQDIPEVEAKIQTDVLFVDSLDKLISLGRLENSYIVDELEKDGDVELAICTEHYGDIVKMVSCQEGDIAWLYELSRCDNISDTLKTIEGARGNITQGFLDEITLRFTDEINVALKYHLQISLSIDNAVSDYADLIDVLKQTYGDEFIQMWNDHQREIIGRALNYLNDERLETYLGTLYEDQEMIQKLQRRVVVFTDRIALTYVDWSSDDMDLAFTGSGAISEATMPNLHKAVMAMFARTAALDVPFNGHLMSTNDNAILEFHKGWLGKDFFLISRFK